MAVSGPEPGDAGRVSLPARHRRRRGRHVHVPEVIVGVHANMRILGLSVITDQCLPDALEPAVLADIIAVANKAEKKLRVLVRRVIEGI